MHTFSHTFLFFSHLLKAKDAEYTCVFSYAALAVNGKMRGVEMNFDL